MKPLLRITGTQRSTARRLAAAGLAVAVSAIMVLVPLSLVSAGTIITSPFQITHAAADQRDVQIALDPEGGVHATWWGYDAGGTAQIWYADNASGSWSAPVNITNAASGHGQTTPQIAVDANGKSHITWQGYDGTAFQVYYTDNVTDDWTTNFHKLTSETRDQTTPQIALDEGGNSHITWSGFSSTAVQIFYDDNVPGNWDDNFTQITNTTIGLHQDQPQIAVDPHAHSHIVWRAYFDDGTHHTHQIMYTDNSAGSFAAPDQVSAGPLDTDQENPQIVADATGRSHVTWDGWDAGTSSPRHIFYADNRDNWLVDLVTTAGEQSNPQIAIDSSRNSYLTWHGWDSATSTNQIYYSDNVPENWTDDLAQLSHATGGMHQYYPQIALDNNASSHVTWQGTTVPTKFPTGGNQIFYSDNIGGWPASPTQVTNAPNADQTNPQIAVDESGQSHIAWQGMDAPGGKGVVVGTGTYQIWYSNGSLRPQVDSVTPPSGPAGTRVTVTGQNFGGAQGGSTVTVGGVEAQVVSWSDTQIVIVVPEGAKSGAVVVTTGVGGSNTDKDFDVTTTDLSTWYLAEGTTAWGFNTYITIQNPNNTDVNAQITYMLPGALAGKGRVLPPRTIKLPALSQTTVDPRWDLGLTDFSTRVVCPQGKPIAVDRTMFWTGPGAASPEGHNSIGVNSPAKTWYLPEGSSAWNFETWTLVENPNNAVATVKLTYMPNSGTPVNVTRTIAPYSRATYNLADETSSTMDASVKVTSDVPVIAEQSMYRDNRREGSCSVGASAPSTDSYMSEGSTAWGFTTYVLVQNPNNTAADVSLTYHTASGPVASPAFTMPANSRKTIKVNDVLEATDFSTQVHASKPVIAQRSMYWGGEPGSTGQACHSSIGLADPHMGFYLPDGQTSNGYETYTCVENPNPGSVRVRVTYMTPSGKGNVTFTDEIAKGSRRTYSMGDKLADGRAAIMVQSLDGARPIMVERSIYWNGRGAGTDTIGGYSD
jgi:hypothetical protein